MIKDVYQKRLEKCGRLMKEAGLDVLLLTKPSNMFYFTGDGRLCAYAVEDLVQKLRNVLRSNTAL